ncbi:MAG: GNAT family N-acetyltransferase [Acidimicrobiia bacterium]|nr:GNAT family N-acetyltransferase [Acidimicrobiia bacterium]
MTIIRPYRVDDAAAVCEVWNQQVPNYYLTPESLTHDDEQVERPEDAGRIVAERDGRVVGAADYELPVGMDAPGQIIVHVYVDPTAEGTGVGTMLYEALMALIEPLEPTSLRSEVSEAHSYARAVAEKHGYTVDKTDWQMIADLTTFDIEEHRHHLDRVADDGIRIASVAELGNDESTQRMFYDVFTTVRGDVPRSHPPAPVSWDVFKSHNLDAPDFLADLTLVAFDGDDAVGTTMSYAGGDEPELHTGLTGVVRNHRGRGIARALKIEALRRAKADGRRRALTDNDENNVAMLAVNESLGYQRQPAMFSLSKAVAPDR